MPKSITACFQNPVQPAPVIDQRIDRGIMLREQGVLYPIRKIEIDEYILSVTALGMLLPLLEFTTRAPCKPVQTARESELVDIVIDEEPLIVLDKMYKIGLLSVPQYATCRFF